MIPIFNEYRSLLTLKKEFDALILKNQVLEIVNCSVQIDDKVKQLSGQKSLINSELKLLNTALEKFKLNQQFILDCLSEIDSMTPEELKLLKENQSAKISHSIFIKVIQQLQRIIYQYPNLFSVKEPLLSKLDFRFIQMNQDPYNSISLGSVIKAMAQSEKDPFVLFEPTKLEFYTSRLKKITAFNQSLDDFKDSFRTIKTVRATVTRILEHSKRRNEWGQTYETFRVQYQRLKREVNELLIDASHFMKVESDIACPNSIQNALQKLEKSWIEWTSCHNSLVILSRSDDDLPQQFDTLNQIVSRIEKEFFEVNEMLEQEKRTINENRLKNLNVQRTTLEVCLFGLNDAMGIIPSINDDFKVEIETIKQLNDKFEHSSDLVIQNQLMVSIEEQLNTMKERSVPLHDYLEVHRSIHYAFGHQLIYFMGSPLFEAKSMIDMDGQKGLEAYSKLVKIRREFELLSSHSIELNPANFKSLLVEINIILMQIKNHAMKSKIGEALTKTLNELTDDYQQRKDGLLPCFDKVDTLLKCMHSYYSDADDTRTSSIDVHYQDIKRLKDKLELLDFKTSKTSQFDIFELNLIDILFAIKNNCIIQQHDLLEQEKVNKRKALDDLKTNQAIVTNFMSKDSVQFLQRLLQWELLCDRQLQPIFVGYRSLLGLKVEFDAYTPANEPNERMNQLTNEITTIVAELSTQESIIKSEYEKISVAMEQFKRNKQFILEFLKNIESLTQHELQLLKHNYSASSSFSNLMNKIEILKVIVKQYPNQIGLNHETLLDVLDSKFINMKTDSDLNPSLDKVIDAFSKNEPDPCVVFEPSLFSWPTTILEEINKFNQLLHDFNLCLVDINAIQGELTCLNAKNETMKQMLAVKYNKWESYTVRLGVLNTLAKKILTLESIDDKKINDFYQQCQRLTTENTRLENELLRLLQMPVIPNASLDRMMESLANYDVSIKQQESGMPDVIKLINVQQRKLDASKLEKEWTQTYEACREKVNVLKKAFDKHISHKPHFLFGDDHAVNIQNKMLKLEFLWRGLTHNHNEFVFPSGADPSFRKQFDPLKQAEHQLQSAIEKVKCEMSARETAIQQAEDDYKKKLNCIEKNLNIIISINASLLTINKDVEQFQTNAASEDYIREAVKTLQLQLQSASLPFSKASIDASDDLLKILNNQETWLNNLIDDLKPSLPVGLLHSLSDKNPFKEAVAYHSQIDQIKVPKIQRIPMKERGLERVNEKIASIKKSLSLLENKLRGHNDNRSKLEQCVAYSKIFESSFIHPVLNGYQYLFNQIEIKYNNCLKSSKNTNQKNISLDHSDSSEFNDIHVDLPILITLYRNLKSSEENYIREVKQDIELNKSKNSHDIIKKYTNECTQIVVDVGPQLEQSDTRQWSEKIIARLRAIFSAIIRKSFSFFSPKAPIEMPILCTDANNVFETFDRRLGS